MPTARAVHRDLGKAKRDIYSRQVDVRANLALIAQVEADPSVMRHRRGKLRA